MRKIADLCGILRSSVFRIAQEGRVNKCSLRPASRRGRPRKLTERQKRLRRNPLRTRAIIRASGQKSHNTMQAHL